VGKRAKKLVAIAEKNGLSAVLSGLRRSSESRDLGDEFRRDAGRVNGISA
jgi:hypothetical protein